MTFAATTQIRAAGKGSRAHVTILLSEGADVNYLDEVFVLVGCTAFDASFTAATLPPRFPRFPRSHPFSSQGRPALVHAAAAGHTTTVNAILQWPGADMTIWDRVRARTPLLRIADVALAFTARDPPLLPSPTRTRASRHSSQQQTGATPRPSGACWMRVWTPTTPVDLGA